MNDLNHALRTKTGKGYRKRENGYETGITAKQNNVYLGTYDTEDEARDAVFSYRKDRFIEGVSKHGLKYEDGVVAREKYVAYPNGKIFNLHGEEMVGKPNRDGYCQGVLNGRSERFHRVIAETFLPRVEGKNDINHIDGNKLNNSIDNLEWCTRSENAKHAFKNGLEKPLCRENHPSHKLTSENARYIRANYKKRDPEYGSKALSEKFNVGKSTILNIIRGETWKEN